MFFIFPLARLFDSLVRVSRRVKVPHLFAVNFEHGTEKQDLRCRAGVSPHPLQQSQTLSPAHLHHSPGPALVTKMGCVSVHLGNAAGVVLTKVMEALPLSLSRLQVLCHSLSKVLFKLSLTLLVRYRSSYSVFNFGRHIPAS